MICLQNMKSITSPTFETGMVGGQNKIAILTQEIRSERKWKSGSVITAQMQGDIHKLRIELYTDLRVAQ